MNEHGGEQQNQRIAALNEITGCGWADSEERLRDDDLWLIEPEKRWAFSFEEDAEDQWLSVVSFLDSIDTHSGYMSPACDQLIGDAQLRAGEMLRRVRERAGETAGS